MAANTGARFSTVTFAEVLLLFGSPSSEMVVMVAVLVNGPAASESLSIPVMVMTPHSPAIKSSTSQT